MEALVARRTYLRTWLLFTNQNRFAKEAKLETAKAQLAAQHNIYPEGHSVGLYEQQARERVTEAKDTHERAVKQRGIALSLEKKWQRLEKDASALKVVKP